MMHAILAGLLCTTAMIVLARHVFESPGAKVSRWFLILYGAGTCVWTALGWYNDSVTLITISVTQLFTCLLVGAVATPKAARQP
jgi:hypothetical protein